MSTSTGENDTRVLRRPDSPVLAAPPPQRPAVRWLHWSVLAHALWQTPVAVALTGVLLAGGFLVAMAAGGAAHAPPHWFYLPALWAGVRFGVAAGALTGVFAGVLAGPLLLADVAAGTAQQPSDWLVRSAMFAVAGAAAPIVKRLVEVALRSRDRRFATLAEHSPYGVARVDRQGHILYVNRGLAQLADARPDELAGRVASKAGLPAMLVDALMQAADAAVRATEPATAAFSLAGPEGEVHLEVDVVPELAAGGEVETLLAAIRDVTHLRRAEEERQETFAQIVAAQEAERARIAADIHDDSVQVMTAVRMRLESLRRAAGDEAALGEQLDRLDETVEAAVERLRSLMFELRPGELDDDELAPLLRAYLAATAIGSAPAWEVTGELPADLGRETREVLYRIAQEAVTNARKHARASRIHIELGAGEEAADLRVTDDGAGFLVEDLAKIGGHHIGVVSMRERAQSLCGRLDIDSTPGAGTTVTVRVPRAASGDRR